MHEVANENHMVQPLWPALLLRWQRGAAGATQDSLAPRRVAIIRTECLAPDASAKAVGGALLSPAA